nr:MAG TPA: Neutrophile activating protein [Caudoviricetes sp.]
MLMDKRTEESLNRLLQELFDGNAIVDNLVYNLIYNGYNELGEAIHKPVAHKLPEWADSISDLIDQMGGRSKRYGLEDHKDDIKEVKDVFKELNNYFLRLREIVNKIIEDVDMVGDAEVRIFLEDFLNKMVMPYVRQSEEWKKASERLSADTFNIHIKEYTHYIKD